MIRTRAALPIVLLLAVHCAKSTPTESPTPEVEQASPLEAEIEATLDRAVDPCDDFYQFACGGWLETAEIPADKPRTGRSFDVIHDRNQELLRDLLEGWAKVPGEDPAAQQLGTYYASCMDTEAVDAAGLTPIQPTLDRIEAIADRKELYQAIADLQMAGEDVFFGVWVGADDGNPDLNILNFSQGGLALPERGYYLGEDEKKAAKLEGYQAMVAAIFELDGDSAEEAAKNAAAVVAVETKMAEASWAQADLYDPEKSYNKIDRAGLAKLMPKYDLDVFLAATGNPELTQINVATPPYFEALGAMLHTEDLGALKQYLRATVLHSNSSWLSSDLDQATFDFFGKQLSGQKEMRPRWKRCVGATDTMLGELLGQAYVDKAFAGDSKGSALAMIQSIETAFEHSLPELAWMDDATRERAIEKARAVRNKIGYPDKWRDYSSLEFGEVWFDNHVAARTLLIAEHVGKAEKPVDRDEWHMSPPTVNAYYSPTGNEIVFPAGILQPPFYDQAYPKAMNYGAIGMVMGHELTHGFDDGGAKYDPTGKLRDWWEPDAVERFEEAAACVQEQYSGFEVQPGLFVDGELTLGENIADFGGIKQAHLAYKAWAAENGEETPVAGFSGEQLLFVAYAQAWCSKSSPEYEQMLVSGDSHSPSRFRINGPLANLPAFGEAFSCEQGKAMRPAETCTVW